MKEAAPRQAQRRVMALGLCAALAGGAGSTVTNLAPVAPAPALLEAASGFAAGPAVGFVLMNQLQELVTYRVAAYG